ncbi:unnamed protein product, partial [Mesorhabditis spiculigera]
MILDFQASNALLTNNKEPCRKSAHHHVPSCSPVCVYAPRETNMMTLAKIDRLLRATRNECNGKPKATIFNVKNRAPGPEDLRFDLTVHSEPLIGLLDNKDSTFKDVLPPRFLISRRGRVLVMDLRC